MIYGVATLAACMLCGSVMGSVFGDLIGAGTEIGSVGFSILLLTLVSNSRLPFVQKPAFVQGVTFWKSMFIPAVIAMTATQDVLHMLSSSVVAIVAGVVSVSVSYLLLYGLHRLGEKKEGAEQ
ncbi:MAG: malonate transporter subunit MadL [Oscillibacter sp.]|nr:malonate transporter subunit MadL [Oscillibacter sp.]